MGNFRRRGNTLLSFTESASIETWRNTLEYMAILQLLSCKSLSVHPLNRAAPYMKCMSANTKTGVTMHPARNICGEMMIKARKALSPIDLNSALYPLNAVHPHSYTECAHFDPLHLSLHFCQISLKYSVHVHIYILIWVRAL